MIVVVGLGLYRAIKYPPKRHTLDGGYFSRNRKKQKALLDAFSPLLKGFEGFPTTSTIKLSCRAQTPNKIGTLFAVSLSALFGLHVLLQDLIFFPSQLAILEAQPRYGIYEDRQG